MRIKTFIITTAAAFALAACGSSDTAALFRSIVTILHLVFHVRILGFSV